MNVYIFISFFSFFVCWFWVYVLATPVHWVIVIAVVRIGHRTAKRRWILCAHAQYVAVTDLAFLAPFGDVTRNEDGIGAWYLPAIRIVIDAALCLSVRMSVCRRSFCFFVFLFVTTLFCVVCSRSVEGILNISLLRSLFLSLFFFVFLCHKTIHSCAIQGNYRYWKITSKRNRHQQ